MVDGADIASNFLADFFGAATHSPVYLSSLPNADTKGREIGERRVLTREHEHIAGFLRKYDRAGRALYFAVATLKPGSATRSKKTLDELCCLHVDIDFKAIVISPEEAEHKLRQIMLLPSKVVHSGGGLHAYWLFKEGLTATPETIEHVETLLKALADHLGGDRACAEVSRLMRLPGSHNSKGGAWDEVRIIADRPLRYELADLEDWLETASPIIERRVAAKPNGHGEDNPWLAFANSQLGGRAPVDVEARLAAMTFQGAGDSGIHMTQLAVTAALLNRGYEIEEVVEMVLDATRKTANGARWDWRREERDVRGMCETWRKKHPEVDEARGEEANTDKTESATKDNALPLLRPYVWRPFSEIPRRQWLHAGHYIREQVVMTVAPGGFGKTSLILCNALEMITGRGLIGPAPAGGDLRVAYWNAEDPDDEIERRIAAACLRHNIDGASLCDQLILGSRLTGKRRIASINRNGNVEFDAAMLVEIERLIRELRLDLVIFDPLIAFHRVPEGDNTLMEQLIKDGFGELATRTACCIELSQHTRKSTQGRTGDLTADDSRGAGAIANAARSVRVLNRMTAEEAELPKIPDEERRHYLRVSRDKTNMAPPGKATWVHLVNVELPNADGVKPGDQVQAIEAWDYPQPLDNVTADDMRWIRDTVRGQNYRADPRSPDWVGRPLASRLGLDPDERGDRKKLSAILRVWFTNGVLAIDTRRDEKRRPRPYVIPGNWNEVASDD
jgi:AAA domain/RepB DNA-primase from phage plasmid